MISWEESDAKAIAAELHQLFSRPGADIATAFAAVFPKYRTVVDAVNRELHHCVKLARDGLPSEALQHVEEDGLLELATAIEDRGDWEEWSALAEQLNLPIGKPLDTKAAAYLNQLYDSVKGIEHLLRRHRRLALARAPLQERLDVMWRMQQKSPGNSTLKQDIEQFEMARKHELLREIQEAYARADAARLKELHKELTDKRWLRPPERRLAEATLNYLRALQRDEAVQRVNDLLTRLERACLEKDEAQARRLWRDWQHWFPMSGLTEDSPFLEASVVNRRWMEGIAARDEALNAFQQALTDVEGLLENLKWRSQWKSHRDLLGKAGRELDRAEAQLKDQGEDIPQENMQDARRVRRQLHERQQEVRGIERGRFVISGILSTVAVVVCGVVATFAANRYSEWKAVNEHATALESLVSRGDLEGTAKYIERLSEDLKAEPQIAEKIGRHASQMQQEEDRRSRFQMLHGGLAQEIEQIVNLEQVTAVGEKVETAQSIAGNDAERSLVDDVRRVLSQKRRELQEQLDKDFMHSFSALREQLAAVKLGDIDGLSNVDTALGQLLRKTDVTPIVRQPAEQLAVANRATLDRWVSDRDERRLAEKLKRQVGDWNRYRESLQEYVDQQPQRARSEEFRRVLREDAAVWASIDPWNQMLAELARTDLSRLTPPAAKELGQRLQTVLKSFPQHPAAASCTPIGVHLDCVASRQDESGKRLEHTLLTVLDNEILGRLFIVQTTDGKRYYCKEPPQQKGNFWSIRYYKSGDFTESSTKQLRAETVKFPAGDVNDPWLAPQSRFAAEARTVLEQLPDDTWDIELIKLLDRLHGNRQMDPLLKYQLLMQFVPVVRKGSATARSALTPIAEHLERAGFDKTADLVNVEDEAADKARYEAEAWSKRLPDPGELLPKIMAAQQAVRMPDLPDQLRWVGYLTKDESDQWTAVTSAAKGSESGRLFLLIPQSDGAWQLVPVGELNGGKSRIVPEPTGHWMQGRPLFLPTPANSI